MRYDILGDELKKFEAVESSRAADLDDYVVVRIDGHRFSKFTNKAVKPVDTRILEAMVAATKQLVADFDAVLGYTQSDEISLVLRAKNGEMVFSGRHQKIASLCAASATSAFLYHGLRLFPDLIVGKDEDNPTLPKFDARSMSFPSSELAAKAILWREVDGRRNAISSIANATFKKGQLEGRSTTERVSMIEDAGIDLSSFPAHFLQGAIVKRMTVERMLTEDELSRIPEAHRPTGPVRRSSIVTLDEVPNLALVSNLADFLFEGEEAIIADRPFAKALQP